jgi:hypothetical protein
MGTNIGNAKDEQLILIPDFSKVTGWEDIRDLMMLTNWEIEIRVSETNTAWLEKISNLQRKGLLKITDDQEQIYVKDDRPVSSSNCGNDSVEQ